MTETLTQQAEQKAGLIDYSLTISPTAISKMIPSEGCSRCIKYRNQQYVVIYNCIILDDRLNSLLQNSNIDNLITTQNLLCQNVSPATPKPVYYTKALYQNSACHFLI
jgi:type II secretory ATPase GspE/PulE/Tfp pilus assembly ATPase PilB-like protein